MGLFLNIVFGAAAGGLAALIVFFLEKRIPPIGKIRGIATIALFVTFWTLSKALLIPPAMSYFAMRDVEEELSKLPAYVAIKQYAPDTYSRVKDQMRSGVAQGKSQVEIAAIVRAEIGALAVKKLPQAGDREAIDYLKVSVQEMKELHARGGGLCYKFVLPQAGAEFDVSRYLSEETKAADMKALTAVLESAATNPQAIPVESEVVALMERAVLAMVAQEGADALTIIQNPAANGLDQERVCEVMIAMYSKIFELPEKDAGRVVRYMLSTAS